MSTHHPPNPPPGVERQISQATMNRDTQLAPGLFQWVPVLPTTTSTGHRNDAPLAQELLMEWQAHQIMNAAVNSGLGPSPGLFESVPVDTTSPAPPAMHKLATVHPIIAPPSLDGPSAQSSIESQASQIMDNAGMSHSAGVSQEPVVASEIPRKVEPMSPEYWAEMLKDYPNPASLTPSPNSIPPTPYSMDEMEARIKEAWRMQSGLATTEERYLNWESERLHWQARMLEEMYRARSKFHDQSEGSLGSDREKEYELRALREQYLRNRERWLLYKRTRYGVCRGGRQMRIAESERVESFGWCGGLVHACALHDVLEEIARGRTAEGEDDYVHRWSVERTARYYTNEDKYIEEERDNIGMERKNDPWDAMAKEMLG